MYFNLAYFPSVETMETRSYLLRFLVFLVIFALLGAARCRPADISADQRISGGGLRAKYSASFSSTFSSMFGAVKLRDGGVGSLRTVSHRLVPTGPNPLHNWLDGVSHCILRIGYDESNQYNPHLLVGETLWFKLLLEHVCAAYSCSEWCSRLIVQKRRWIAQRAYLLIPSSLLPYPPIAEISLSRSRKCREIWNQNKDEHAQKPARMPRS